MPLATIIGLAAALFTTSAFLPQVIRAWRTRSTRDLSLQSFATYAVGLTLWLIYGLMRTSEGYSNTVSASNGLFTLIGFMGLYTLLGLLFTVLIYREIEHGPEPKVHAAEAIPAD